MNETKNPSAARPALNLTIIGNPILSQPTVDLSEKELYAVDDLAILFDEMAKLMSDAGGIGLAAPQVNIGSNFFVFKTAKGEPYAEVGGSDSKHFDGSTLMLINAKVTPFGKIERQTEGCLSIPDVNIPVKRKTGCTVEGYVFERETNSVKKVEWILVGNVARVVMHEYDHCCGIMITDPRRGDGKFLNRKKVVRIKEKYLRWETVINEWIAERATKKATREREEEEADNAKLAESKAE